MLLLRIQLSFWCTFATLATALVVLPDDALSQGTQSQRHLTGQGAVSPLEQYRMLMQLQRATQQASAEELKKKLGLNEEQLKKLSEVFNTPGGMYQSDLPSQIKQLALEHPEVIERAVEIQKQLQRLQNQSPDATPDEESINPNTPFRNQPNGIPDESEASAPQHNRRSEASPVEQDSKPRPTSPRPQQNQTGATAPTQPRHNSLPDAFEDLLEYAPGARRGPESLVARARRPNDAAASANQREIPLRPAMPSNIGQELAKRGWKNTLKQLVQTARKEVRGVDASGTAPEDTDSSTSIWNRTITSAFDFVREDVIEIVKEQQRQTQLEQQKNSSPDGSRFRPRSRQQGNIIPDQPAKPTTASTVPAEPNPTPLSFDDALPQLPEDISTESVFPFLLVVGVVVACLLLASRHQSLRQSSRTHFRSIPVKPADIRSREDVVRAFHRLTEATAPDFAEWWHHRRAQETMVEYSPERKDAIRKFAGLYELARYDTNAESFDEDRIQQARDALAGCLT